jgi:peptide/nickel transport system permease protein
MGGCELIIDETERDGRSGVVPVEDGPRDSSGRSAGPWRWIGLRLLLGVGTLLVVTFLIFLATSVLPGDAARSILGYDASPQALEELREQLGLNEPPLNQMLAWLGGVLTGDLGTSLTAKQPVAEYVAPLAVNTLTLMGAALLVSVPVSFLVGSWAAGHRDSAGDRVAQGVSLVLLAVPDFIIGILLVMLLATNVLQLLPAVTIIPSGQSIFAHLEFVVLPALTIALALIPYLTLMIRTAVSDTIESEYVLMARLKGVSEWRIIASHALRNALGPILQSLALAIAWSAGGVVVIEVIFNYPGLGRALKDAIGARDLPVIQAVTLMLASLIVITNLLADVLTVLVTPRLRTEQGR